MLNDATFSPILVEVGHAIRIDDGKGTEICNVTGNIWITQEGDQRDIVLGPGEMFAIDRDGLTLLVALGETAAVRIIAGGDTAVLQNFIAAGLVGAGRCAGTADTRNLQVAA